MYSCKNLDANEKSHKFFSMKAKGTPNSSVEKRSRNYSFKDTKT